VTSDPSLSQFSGGYLYTKDGLRFRFNSLGQITAVRDRNGNITAFVYGTNANDVLTMNRLIKVTSSSGQVIDVVYGQGNVFFDELRYTGSQGVQRRVRVHFCRLDPLDAQVSCPGYAGPAAETFFSLFAMNGSTTTKFNPLVVSSVELPDSRRYNFRYNSYGEIESITLPTGGQIAYTHGPGAGNPQDITNKGVIGPAGGPLQIYRRLLKREVRSAVPGTPERVTTYTPTYYTPSVAPECVAGIGWCTSVVVEDKTAAGVLMQKAAHYFYGGANDPANYFFSSYYPRRLEGREYKTEVYKDSVTLLSKTDRVWQERPCVAGETCPASTGTSSSPVDMRVSSETLTLSEGNLTSTQSWTFDRFNNPATETVLGYDNAVIRTVSRSFLSNVGSFDYASIRYTSGTTPIPDIGTTVHLRSALLSESIGNGATTISQTDFEYDNYTWGVPLTAPLKAAPLSNAATWDSTVTPRRGNVSKTTRAVRYGADPAVVTYTQYDETGNIVALVDGRTKTTTIHYGSACNATTPIRFTNAKNQVTSVEYDCATGAMTKFTDPNSQSSNYAYNDALDRLTSVTFPDGGQTSYQYCDTGSTASCGSLPGNSVQTTTLQNSCISGAATNSLVSLALYDRLGRTLETRQIEAATTITSKTVFDGLGRPVSASLPYRGGGANAVWRSTAYDVAGRVTSLTEPDNAVTTISYLGSTITTTDAAGKARKQTIDGAGRLVQVAEGPSGENLLTSYRYDSLNNLVKVCQGGIMDSAGACPAGALVRTFDYDALGRLRRAGNPESGNTNYTYDSAGNLLTKLDARGITTTMVYDDLNRLLSKSYSDTTFPVEYKWDSVFVGRLASVGNANSTSRILSYDAMGRPMASEQSISSTEAYRFAYTYNKAGHLETETYPSQRVVKQCYDEAGRVKSVSSRASAGATETVIASVEAGTNPQNPLEAWPGYTALGGMLQLRLGNGKVEQRCYNSRGQQTELRLGGVYTTNCVRESGDLFRAVLAYGTTTNNGNVLTQQVEARKDDQTFLTLAQSYSYDGLSRLRRVEETGGTAWWQSFAYDRNGNQAVTATFPMTGMAVNLLDRYDLGTNRLRKYNDGTNLPTGVYDAAGNLANHRDLGAVAYDAENRMTQVVAGAVSNYRYDGEGWRVRGELWGGV